MPISNLVEQLLATLPMDPRLTTSWDYVAVPAAQPRWLIPTRGRNLDAALQSWSPYRLSSRLKWTAVRSACAIGALRALPQAEVIRLENVSQIDWRAVGWECDLPPIPLIYVGTPGPRRKVVIHLVDPSSGSCKAIVKVPLGPEARGAILREADVLNTLAAEHYPFSPRLTHLDRDRGISTQQFLPGPSAELRLRPEYWELLRALLSADATTTLAEHAAFWLEQSCVETAGPRLYASLMSALSDDRSLPACRIHGDFTPWNIRRPAHSAPALIDWEHSQDRGLPLQDAFHFLHMTDFLFNRRPATHSEEVQSFARSQGIAPDMCRKLEIAYLARTYADCSPVPEQQAQSSFVLRTLALVIGDQRPPISISPAAGHRLRLVSSRPATSSRAELLDAVVAQFNGAGVPYCILGGYENHPGAQQSDVDIMFRPQDLRRVPDLLAQTARSAGALLIQAIQHEATACYFVLARDNGRPIAHLDLDCYSDYRRDARTWLPAENVIANRRRYRRFYVPAVADEFHYYLIKKILKQALDFHQLKRLQHLFARDPMQCRQRIASLLSPSTARLLERAIVEQKLLWIQVELPTLLAEVQRSRRPQSPVRRCLGTLLETARFARRIAAPTGLSVVITGGDGDLRSQIVDGLVSELAPAFRHTRNLGDATLSPQRLHRIFGILAARIRSTLVVRAFEEPPPVTKARQALHRLQSSCSRLLPPVDLLIDLCHVEQLDTTGNITGQGVLRLNADSSTEQIIQSARRAILRHMMLRTQRRLKLRDACDARIDAALKDPALHSAGLD